MNTKSKQSLKSFRTDRGKFNKYIEHIPKNFFIPGYVLVRSEIDGKSVALFVCKREQFKNRSFLIEVSNCILKQLGLYKTAC